MKSYVILLAKGGLPRLPPQIGVIEAGGTRIETRFHLIFVWQISARETLDSGHAALLPFVQLMDGGREEVEAGVERLRDVPDEAQRLEMALHFVKLSGLRYNPLEILELVGRRGMIVPEFMERDRISLLFRFQTAEWLLTLAVVQSHLASSRELHYGQLLGSRSSSSTSPSGSPRAIASEPRETRFHSPDEERSFGDSTFTCRSSRHNAPKSKFQRATTKRHSRGGEWAYITHGAKRQIALGEK